MNQNDKRLDAYTSNGTNATINNASLEIAVAIAAHSIHQPNQNINIGSKIRFTQPATSVGIIPNLASHTQRKIPVAAIHTNMNGKLTNIILK